MYILAYKTSAQETPIIVSYPDKQYLMKATFLTLNTFEKLIEKNSGLFSIKKGYIKTRLTNECLLEIYIQELNTTIATPVRLSDKLIVDCWERYQMINIDQTREEIIKEEQYENEAK